MTDRLTPEQRTKNMSAVRSRGNRSTEQAFVSLLKERGITGWRRHIRELPGTPDFTFSKIMTTVFIDGCFWHGCGCKTLPVNNKKFWEAKIGRNKARDKEVDKELKRMGWKVIRIKEHQLKGRGVIKKLEKLRVNLNM